VAAENKGPPQGSEDIKADHEEYLTVRQAAERIKYRERTLRNMMSGGVFRRGVHYYKRRGRVLFLWSRMEQASRRFFLQRRHGFLLRTCAEQLTCAEHLK
jgi:hypothetical protein